MSQLSEHHEHAVKGSEVFVGGLPLTVTEGKIHELFSHYGEVVEIRLIKDQNGSVKGFCFVRFATKEAAEKAVKEKNGTVLDGKKIGVLPSIEQNTLYFGNLNKGWTANEFEGIVRQVFPDVVSVDLALPLSSGETQSGRNQRNRGFAFVKFSSHAAAARAYRVGSKPEFVLGGNLHPVVQWAEDEPEIDPTVLAKIKIAFIRNLPTSADENYLGKLFEPFGQIEKVVLWTKGSSPVGFVHFTERSDLDHAIKELNGKTVQGPNGGPTYKLSVEVAKPMDKSRKRAREDSERKVLNNIPSHLSKNNRRVSSTGPTSEVHASQKHQEVEYDDPYEAAVLALPASVKGRLLQILRLGIATRFDIGIQSLSSLKELPESTAISVLDQFMLSGADTTNKGVYLAGLISRHQVDKQGLDQFAGSLSRVANVAKRDFALSSFSSGVHVGADDSLTSRVGSALSSFINRVHLPDVDSFRSPTSLSIPRSDDYSSRYSAVLSDSPLLAQASFGRMKETSCSPIRTTSTSSMPYNRLKFSPPRIAAKVECQPTRTQVRFDPFTGEPYKFDPFTGERILPETPPRPF